jgi:hypothetical protein
MTIADVIGDKALVGILQRGKIKFLNPVLGHEIPDQTCNHLRMGEQLLV